MNYYSKFFLIGTALATLFFAGEVFATNGPEIDSINPPNATTGDPNFELFIDGEKFKAGLTVRFSSYFLNYQFIAPQVERLNDFTVVIHNFSVSLPGGVASADYSVTATNPQGPHEGTSNAVPFTVYNAPPSANNFSVNNQACPSAPGDSSVEFSWTYQDIDSNNQKSFQLQIDDNSNFNSPVVNRTIDGLSNPPGAFNNQSVGVISGGNEIDSLLYNKTYYWKVQVCQYPSIPSLLSCSNWVSGDSFDTISHAGPLVNFSFTGASEKINFTNESTCYDIDGICNSYLWDFGDTTTSALESPPLHEYEQAGPFNVVLRVTDGSLIECLDSDTVNPIQAAPIISMFWQEIAVNKFDFEYGQTIQCSDFIDNDSDGKIDFADEFINNDCTDPSDSTECSGSGILCGQNSHCCSNACVGDPGICQ